MSIKEKNEAEKQFDFENHAPQPLEWMAKPEHEGLDNGSRTEAYFKCSHCRRLNTIKPGQAILCSDCDVEAVSAVEPYKWMEKV